jgi:heme oxygenase
MAAESDGPTGGPVGGPAGGEGFAARLRAGTRSEHEAAEGSPFMANLLGGRLRRSAYTALTSQLWFVYRALEDSAERLADDPVIGPLIDPALFRTPALEADLAHLLGPDWHAEAAPLPATRAYADRIREVAAGWPAGYAAHHYTRYLGDLAGGQVIRSVAERTWGFPHKGDGVRFYVFDQVPNPAGFRRGYRARLDALPLDEVAQRRVADEAARAFRLNRALFRELDGRFPLSA